MSMTDPIPIEKTKLSLFKGRKSSYPHYSSLLRKSSDVDTSTECTINELGFLGIKLSTPVVLIVATLFIILLAIVGIISQEYAHKGCFSSPYIYVSDKGYSKVYKISRNGCVLTTRALWYGADEAQRMKEYEPSYRGMLAQSDKIYVVDSTNDQIMLFGKCAKFGFGNGLRSYIGPAITLPPLELANYNYHPYSITFDAYDNLYVSAQHTNSVFRYHRNNINEISNKKDLYSPTTPPRDLKSIWYNATNIQQNSIYSYPNGTFVQFGAPGYHAENDQGIRAILWIPSLIENSLINNLWIAQEDYNHIYMVNTDGVLVNKIKVTNPIGLYYSGTPNSVDHVYVTSKGKKKIDGNVYLYNTKTLKKEKSFTLIGMTHPTSVLEYEGVLYVSEQVKPDSLTYLLTYLLTHSQPSGQILTFNVTTTRFIRTIYTGLPDALEIMTFSNC